MSPAFSPAPVANVLDSLPDVYAPQIEPDDPYNWPADELEAFEAAAKTPELEEPDPYDFEPRCECVQIDVDLEDASRCELCNPESAWNRWRRRYESARGTELPLFIEPVYEFAGEVTDDDCPF